MQSVGVDRDASAKPLLFFSGLALALAVLLRGALALSSNPVDGETGYDVTEWLAGLLQMVAVGLFSAWAAVRALSRSRDHATATAR